MSILKEILGEDLDKQVDEKLKGQEDKFKLANLASGQYVDKAKFDGKVTELGTANQTIKDLQNTVKKFDGVDIEKLKNDVGAWEQKYNTDTAKLRADNALELALIAGKAKNSKAVKALLDHEKIKLDGDKLLGLDDQLEALKKSDPYLFEEVEKKDPKDGQQPPNQSGVRLNSGAEHKTQNNPDYSKMSDQDYYADYFKKKE